MCELAIGILSGTGSDGTMGIRAIKGSGGMVIVQDPAGLEFDMPRNAINTGLVDYILPSGKMADKLIAFTNQSVRNYLPELSYAGAIMSFGKYSTYCAQSGHDFFFIQAKHSLSCVEAHGVTQIDSIQKYVSYLRSTPEVGRFCDLLIGVTNFSRP